MYRRWLVLLLLGVSLLSACSTPSLPVDGPPPPHPPPLTRLLLPAGMVPERITPAPDGALYFTASAGPDHAAIGRISQAARITLFPLPARRNTPLALTIGPDGTLWFTEPYDGRIGRLTPGGTLTEVALPHPTRQPFDLTAGPDGNLWFTETDRSASDWAGIGRLTPAGSVTEFALPSPQRDPSGITVGPDGNLWFTETATHRIGRLSPRGRLAEFALPTALRPVTITSGPDASLWFTADPGVVGRITTTGQVTTLVGFATLGMIASTPAGDLWWTEVVSPTPGFAASLDHLTVSGAVQRVPLPRQDLPPTWLAIGTDGHLWYTDASGFIGRLAATTSPAVRC